ncbi:MAG: L,D-transpeptidase [Chloroflexi bacterium]|nr:L,D-transpeptidase [Chloroflexota bacterium]
MGAFTPLARFPPIRTPGTRRGRQAGRQIPPRRGQPDSRHPLRGRRRRLAARDDRPHAVSSEPALGRNARRVRLVAVPAAGAQREKRPVERAPRNEPRPGHVGGGHHPLRQPDARQSARPRALAGQPPPKHAAAALLLQSDRLDQSSPGGRCGANLVPDPGTLQLRRRLLGPGGNDAPPDRRRRQPHQPRGGRQAHPGGHHLSNPVLLRGQHRGLLLPHFQRRAVRLPGQPRGRLEHAARPAPHLAQGCLAAPERRLGCRRLGPARSRLDDPLGVAIHSTYWHNNYGVPTSRGCVNARPDDAKWIFRWTQPVVPYDPGDVTVSMPGGTLIEVTEKQL